MLLNTWKTTIKRDITDAVSSLALEMLREYDSHTSAGYFLAQAGIGDSRITSHTRLGGLHCASFFAIVEFITALIEMVFNKVQVHRIQSSDSD